MTVSKKDRSRTLALVKDVAECELDFNIGNVCAVLGCDWRFPKYSWLRIADLIDPDCGTQEADSSPVPEHNADLSKMVDRDALLALAEEAKKCAWYFGFNHDNDELKDRLEEAAADFSDFDRRIREACGEVGR